MRATSSVNANVNCVAKPMAMGHRYAIADAAVPPSTLLFRLARSLWVEASRFYGDLNDDYDEALVASLHVA